MKAMKEFYEAPVCEVLEVKFEGMLCLSNRSLGIGNSSSSDNNVEDRQNGGTWGNGDWF